MQFNNIMPMILTSTFTIQEQAFVMLIIQDFYFYSNLILISGQSKQSPFCVGHF